MVEYIVIALLRSLVRSLLPSAVLVLACGSLAGYAQEGAAYNQVEEAAQQNGRRLQYRGMLQEHAAPLLPDPAVFSPQDRIALYFVEQGQAALGQEDFHRARIFFERAVNIAPLQPYGYYFLGRATFAQGDAHQALVFLLKAELALSEENADWMAKTRCLQGMIHEDLGEYGEARCSYQRCLEISPQSLRAMSGLARLPDENEQGTCQVKRN